MTGLLRTLMVKSRNWGIGKCSGISSPSLSAAIITIALAYSAQALMFLNCFHTLNRELGASCHTLPCFPQSPWIPSIQSARFYCMLTKYRTEGSSWTGTKWSPSLHNSTLSFYKTFVHLLYIYIYFSHTAIDTYKIILIKTLNRSSRKYLVYEWMNKPSWCDSGWHSSTAGSDSKVSPVSRECQECLECGSMGRVEFLSDTFLSCSVSWAGWRVAEDTEATYGLWDLSVAPSLNYGISHPFPHPQQPKFVSQMRC